MKRFILTIAIFLISLFGFSQSMVLVGTSLGFNRSIICSTYSQERWCHYCEWNGWSHYHYYDYVYPTRVATTIRVYHSAPAPHPAHHHHYVPPKPKPTPQHTGTHNVAPRPKSSSTVRQSAPQHKPSSSSSVRSSSTRTSTPRSTTNTRR